MAGSAVNYGLGNFGVNVDKSEIELADGELREAQNATQNPLGTIGGIEKRPGLVPITPDMGDAVLGGIGVPFALRVSAINGTTLSNDPGPGGQPGSALPVGGTPNPGGAGGVGGGGHSGIPVTTIIVYRRESTDGTNGAVGHSYGIWGSQTLFTTAAGEQAKGVLDGTLTPTTASDPLRRSVSDSERTKVLQTDAVTYSPGMNFATGSWEFLSAGIPNSAVVINNRIYFAPEVYALNSAGTPDVTANSVGQLWVSEQDVTGPFGRPLFTLPAYGVGDITILSIIANAGIVYFLAHSAGGGPGANSGDGTYCRVFSYDPATDTLLQLGSNGDFTATTGAPISICWHAGSLWVGTRIRSAAAPGRVYSFTPNIGQTNWVLDHTAPSNVGITVLLSYQGYLFAGGYPSAGTAGVVEKRDALGAWTTSLTLAASHFANGAVIFNNNLYLSDNQVTGAVPSVLRKFDGTTWSLVYSSAYTFLSVGFEAGSTLFFTGGGDAFGAGLMSSPDGTTWTDRTANLTNTTGKVLAAGGVIVYQEYF